MKISIGDLVASAMRDTLRNEEFKAIFRTAKKECQDCGYVEDKCECSDKAYAADKYCQTCKRSNDNCYCGDKMYAVTPTAAPKAAPVAAPAPTKATVAPTPVGATKKTAHNYAIDNLIKASAALDAMSMSYSSELILKIAAKVSEDKKKKENSKSLKKSNKKVSKAYLLSLAEDGFDEGDDEIIKINKNDPKMKSSLGNHLKLEYGFSEENVDDFFNEYNNKTFTKKSLQFVIDSFIEKKRINPVDEDDEGVSDEDLVIKIEEGFDKDDFLNALGKISPELKTSLKAQDVAYQKEQERKEIENEAKRARGEKVEEEEFGYGDIIYHILDNFRGKEVTLGELIRFVEDPENYESSALEKSEEEEEEIDEDDEPEVVEGLTRFRPQKTEVGDILPPDEPPVGVAEQLKALERAEERDRYERSKILSNKEEQKRRLKELDAEERSRELESQKAYKLMVQSGYFKSGGWIKQHVSTLKARFKKLEGLKEILLGKSTEEGEEYKDNKLIPLFEGRIQLTPDQIKAISESELDEVLETSKRKYQWLKERNAKPEDIKSFLEQTVKTIYPYWIQMLDSANILKFKSGKKEENFDDMIYACVQHLSFAKDVITDEKYKDLKSVLPAAQESAKFVDKVFDTLAEFKDRLYDLIAEKDSKKSQMLENKAISIWEKLAALIEESQEKIIERQKSVFAPREEHEKWRKELETYRPSKEPEKSVTFEQIRSRLPRPSVALTPEGVKEQREEAMKGISKEFEQLQQPESATSLPMIGREYPSTLEPFISKRKKEKAVIDTDL